MSIDSIACGLEVTTIIGFVKKNPKIQKMAKVGSDHPGPGAARNGNFQNYYQFNPPMERISLLPKDLFKDLKRPASGWKALDVGCNSGDLTCSLLEHLAIDWVLGVDIDRTLIDFAKEKHEEFLKANEDRIKFVTMDMTKDCNEVIQDLKSQLPGEADDPPFGVIFCFSVSMWIHLNHGDEGLQNFIRTISKLTHYLVLEPQPWKCYRTASRRMRKLGQPDFEQLKLMKNTDEESLMNHIDFICGEAGFKKLKVFGETSNWKRKLILFQKI